MLVITGWWPLRNQSASAFWAIWRQTGWQETIRKPWQCNEGQHKNASSRPKRPRYRTKEGLRAQSDDQVLTNVEVNDSPIVVNASVWGVHPTRLERVTYSSVDCRSALIEHANSIGALCPSFSGNRRFCLLWPSRASMWPIIASQASPSLNVLMIHPELIG